MAAIDAYPSPVKQLTEMAEWENMQSRYQWSGVDGSPGGDQLRPSLDTANRRITTQAGAALIRGVYRATDTPESTNVPSASASNRIDRLVWRYNRAETTTAANVIVPHVIQGTPGSSTPPDIVQTSDGLFDIKICRWTSASTGALTGLVDERAFLSTQGPVPCFSYARPICGIGTLIYEIDTGVTRIGDGTNWHIVAEDTGDIALSSAQANWLERSPNCVGRRLDGVAYIDINLSRENTTVQAPLDDAGSNLVQLPANLRPARDKYFSAHLTGDRHGRLDVQSADGLIVLRHIDADIAAGRYLRASISYPVA